MSAGPAPEDKVVNVFNWTDYIGETTIEDFQNATGIEVTYDTYDSAETVEAKMMAGTTGYDVVDQPARQACRASFRAKLSRSSTSPICPTGGNLDPAILKIIAGRDPGNDMAFPICGEPSASPSMSTWSRSASPMRRPQLDRDPVQTRIHGQACRLRH